MLSYTMSYVEDIGWNGEYCAWENGTGDLVHTSEDMPPREMFFSIYAPLEKSIRRMNFGQW